MLMTERHRRPNLVADSSWTDSWISPARAVQAERRVRPVLEQDARIMVIRPRIS